MHGYRSTQYTNDHGAAELPEDLGQSSYTSVALNPLEAAKLHLWEGTKKFKRCSSSTVKSSSQKFSQALSEVANRATVFTDLHFPYSKKLMRSLRDDLKYTDENFKKNFQKKIGDFKKLSQKQATSVAVLLKVYRMLRADFEDLQNRASTIIDSIQAEAAQKSVDSRDAHENAQSEKARFDEEAKIFHAKARKLCKEKGKWDDQKERYEEQAMTSEYDAYTKPLRTAILSHFRFGLEDEATKAKRHAETATEKGEECARSRKKAIEDAKRAKANGENAVREAEQAMQEARKCDTAAGLYQNDMTDCLSRYIKAMEKVSEFFSYLESELKRCHELERCHGEVNAARTTHSNRETIISIRRYVDGILKSCDLFETFQTEVQANLPILSEINTKDLVTGWCAKCEASGRLQPDETRDILHRLGLQHQDPERQQSSGINQMQILLLKATPKIFKHRLIFF